MNAIHVLLVLAAVSFSGRLAASPLTPAQKQSDLDQLISLIKSGYGPLLYKKQVLGIDVDDLAARYRPLAAATASNADFYYLINRFVAEFKDSHFSARIPTDHKATLGFMVDLVEDRVLIDEIDRAALGPALFPFERGDEIVEFGGKPVAEALDELGSYLGEGNPRTQRRLAAILLTLRRGSRLPVPHGSAELAIRRGTSAVVDRVSLPWIEAGTPLDENAPPAKAEPAPSNQLGDLRRFQISIADKARDLAGDGGWSYWCSGTTRIAVPDGAVMIMTDPFVAYYHPTPKGNVGYLRIPHYYPQSPITGAFEYDLRLAQYEYAVSVLEQNTVGLVIDQDHNCGGSVEYLESMAGLFVPGPYDPLKFRFLATKAEYLMFKDWLDELNPFTLPYRNFQDTVDLVRRHWEAGDFMTPLTSFNGTAQVPPRPTRYTKPVVMLVDEMSGSGGDAFPALLQGYGRAKLVGSRTMGAGGHVMEQPVLFYSAIEPRMTKSLFYRPDGVEVENNGAAPDYPYTITRDDLLYGYRGYRDFYLSKLLELLP